MGVDEFFVVLFCFNQFLLLSAIVGNDHLMELGIIIKNIVAIFIFM